MSTTQRLASIARALTDDTDPYSKGEEFADQEEEYEEEEEWEDEDPQLLDRMVEQASAPTLAQLFRKAREQNLIEDEQHYH